jgi:hypothetical protein
MWWRKHLDAHDLVTDAHFWDLGKLGFAFTAFFGYISFSQYLVIWYGNMPEGRSSIVTTDGRVAAVTTLIPFAFVLPFFGLISSRQGLSADVRAVLGVQPDRDLPASLHRGVSVHLWRAASLPFGLWEIGTTWLPRHLGALLRGVHGRLPGHAGVHDNVAIPDEVQVPVDARTMEPLPAHD